jgi:hypothetical protein
MVTVAEYLCYHLHTNNILPTERHGRVVKAPASYSGCVGFDSRPQIPAIMIDVFSIFPQFLQTNAGLVP